MEPTTMVDAVASVCATTDFSGVVRIDLPGDDPIELASGLADRRWAVANAPATRFGIASGTKGFTALTVMALVDRGALSLATTARSLLGRDLPLIDERVTVEHLLAHRSGIGDYLDESTAGPIDEHVMPIPVHRLDRTEAYLEVLDGHPQVTEPGARFAYNNGGYVVLALLAERAAGAPFEHLVDELVCRPAALVDTGFVRTDAPAPGVATGYLDATGWRTNALHLPVVGSGDGGLTSTAADVERLWRAFAADRIVRAPSRAAMTTPRSHEGELAYGLGFWLRPGAVQLEGYDAGVSFRSTHLLGRDLVATVISNTSDGAWPVAREIDARLGLGAWTAAETEL